MEFTQAELIRDYVKQLLAENSDLLSTHNKRLQAVELFLQKHADRKFKKDSIKVQFERILNQEGKKIGKSKKDFGKKPKTPSFKINSDMEAEISGAPQNLEHLKQSPEAPKLAEGEKKEGVPTLGDSIVFEAQDVSAAIAAFWLMIKIMFPTLELLTEEEKASLGRLWLPAFKKYLTENWKIIGIPLLATLGMMLPKIKKARDTKIKEKKLKNSQADNNSKVDKLTCPWCNKLFDAELIENHKENCPVKKKYDK